jgi:PhnB protein
MKINPYLNFDGTCEEAFNLYKDIFGGEFAGNGIMRFGDIPPQEDAPPISDEVKNRVMHVALQIGDATLMGSDIMPGMCNSDGGTEFRRGDNVIISISPDSREDADRITPHFPTAVKPQTQCRTSFGAIIGECWSINSATSG